MSKMENKGNFKEEEEEEEEQYCYCCKADDHDDGDERNITSVKRTISCHPFYPVFLQSHLDCLKLCLGENGDIIDAVAADHIKLLDSSAANQPDLDQFMEAYCMTLKKLKQAIEQPQRESMAFITNMHSQLEKLKEECPSPPASSFPGPRES